MSFDTQPYQLKAGEGTSLWFLGTLHPRVAQRAKLKESGAHETGMYHASKRRWKNILMIE